MIQSIDDLVALAFGVPLMLWLVAWFITSVWERGIGGTWLAYVEINRVVWDRLAHGPKRLDR